MGLNKRDKQSILLFADWFEPGFKAGGPIRSCLNFAQQMKDEYAVHVITTDRDFNSSVPYQNIIPDQWSEFDEGIRILYCSPGSLKWKNILQQIRKIEPDFVYMNSMYSRFFTVYPLVMKRMGLISAKLVLAPRGMLRSTAVQFKRPKKKIFFAFLRRIGIHKLIHFHATDEAEANDVKGIFGEDASISVIPNFSANIKASPAPVIKSPGEISIIFVGRLHPIKNLDYALDLLPKIKGSVNLTIVGTEENIHYVSSCKEQIRMLPANINVRMEKELPNKQLSQLIRHHHLFVLPTQGENFGHAIFEAMAEGRPVLISDQTPWRNLSEVRAGWDISLKNKDQFVKSLQHAIDFTQEEYNEWSFGAWQYALSFAERSDIKSSYHKLFS